MDHNWRIYAIVSTPDRELPLRSVAKADGEQPSIAYNVYRDGELLAEIIPQETFTVENPQSGRYYVTAVKDGEESGESNAVVYTKSSGVVDVVDAAAAALVYDSASATVKAGQVSDIAVYSATGALVVEATAVSSLSVSHLPAGVYVVTARGEGATASIKIVR